ncbi:MAG: hypothetical protein L0J57_00630 [Brachybacterium sp.]|uniref:hypothetical protein n=1 Tax=Brachybacterium alimentarium TaxID=47845 RepID=UPI000DF43F73|nr:hypothetical protein [Brachybacterium alimentarium]MDN5601260.1 hypothetical protein [Brachybacterium sp.]MDN6301543.1 hypothetical protein [Brachybacterium sp.]RCS68774.1 hypothetical protein CIK68_12570 [Brachybacterium alimentarium]
MNEPLGVLDTDPLGIGITFRWLAILAFIAVGIIGLLATLINGLPGRATCGAPRRGQAGRCRRDMMTNGSGCGIHSSSWPIVSALGIVVVGACAAALLLNAEAVLAWGQAQLRDMTSAS